MLNARQQAFVDHYLTCGNGSEAARRAGYSPRTAKQMASELLTKPVIQAAIAAGRQQAHEHAGIDAVKIVRELCGIAFAEVGEPVKLSHKLRALEVLIQQRIDQDHERRLAQLEAQLGRVGKYASLHEVNGHGD